MSSGLYSGEEVGVSQDSCFSLANRTNTELSIHGILLSTIILVSLCGNGLVLLLVSRYKRLRCRSVVVSLSVVAADILITLSYTLPVLVTTALQRWPFMDAGCTVFGYLSVQFLNARWLIMGLLCLDRFCTVRFPYTYERYSKCFLITLTVLAWGLPFIVGTPSLVDFAKSKLRENVPTCLPDCRGNRRCAVFYLVYISAVYVLGCLLPIVLYIWLYWKAKKLRGATVTLGRMSVQAASASEPVATLEKDSRENRALITFFIIFLTILVTGTPPYFIALLRNVAAELHCRIPEMILFLNSDLLLLSTALDPFVIMRDRDFRECIKHLFCCSARTEDSSFPIPIATTQLSSKHPSIASIPSIDDSQRVRNSSASSSSNVSLGLKESTTLLNGMRVPNGHSLPEISEVYLELTTSA